MKLRKHKLFKNLIGLLVLICLLSTATVPAYAEDKTDFTKPILNSGPEISSSAAIIMDINSGAVLYGKNTTGKIQPSSLTKLVTAAVAADRLDPSAHISISLSAASQDFPTASNVGLKTNQTISGIDAINGMLCISAEDCTVAIAEKISGNMNAFAELMNSYCLTNEYLNSHFTNATGRANADNYSCVYDLAVTACHLMKNHRKLISSIFTSEYSLTSCNKKINNTHRFMNGTERVSSVYAGKTGGSAYNGDGSWALCTFANQGNLNLVCIIGGAPQLSNAYEDTKQLLNFAFENYEAKDTKDLVNSKSAGIEKLFSIYPIFTLNPTDSFSTDELSYITLPQGASLEDVKRDVILNDNNGRFVNGYNHIGTIAFEYNSRYVGSCNIYYYTERDSITESEFNNIFPGFLIHPEEASALITAPKSTHQKATLFNRFLRGFYDIFTPAKLYALFLSIVVFAFGTVIIFLVFPIREAISYDNLYKKSFKDSRDIVLPDDELSDVTRIRQTDNADMQEISFDDNKY